MRIACLLVPDLPLRAELRAHPELADRPVVVASGPGARAEIISVSPEATALGVRPSGTVRQALASCGEVLVRVASPALTRSARETLLDIALSFSPRAALAPRATGAFLAEASVFFDATGITSLFHSEEGFAAAVDARATALELPGVVSVASSRAVAHLAARCTAMGDAAEQRETRSTCVLPPGSEEAFLGPLPIDLLDPEDTLAQALTRFGVHRVRDLLRLPRRSLAHRLGPEMLRLVARASGREVEPPLPQPTSARLEEAIELEHPIALLEPLRFALRGLLARLIERLVLRGLACGPLDLELGLEGGGRAASRIGVAGPTRDVRVLLRLLTLALEAHPPAEPIERIRISTSGHPVRTDQLDLFAPRGPDPAALDRTLSELESLCGEGRVGAPTVADDHRPGAFALAPFQLPSPLLPSLPVPGEAPERTEGGLAVRALRPPVFADVRVQGVTPTSIRSAVANGALVNVAGPWRTTGRWWSETERFALDQYDVQVADGTVLRLCYDWIERSWRIDALYD